jgi:drug/metabolite transporter (DMT)-like permease
MALAAIWGAGFIFIRVAAPALGTVWLTEARLIIGAGALLAWYQLTKFDMQWRGQVGFYLLIGLLGTALPFVLVGFAASYLPAAMMAILNTTAPMFALLVGAAFGVERLSLAKAGGIGLGAIGVWLVVRPTGTLAVSPDPMLGWAMAACLGAAFSYGVSAQAARRWGKGVAARGTALGTQVFAALILLPLVPFAPLPGAPSLVVAANVAALGVLGGAIALILFFRLVADVGATGAQTVSLLIPAFGMLWGAVFLGESLGGTALAGAALIVAGTVLVMRSR